jgi:hypothetical protein
LLSDDIFRCVWIVSVEGDGGLAHLEGLTDLQSLHLFGAKITHAGLEKLQQALPDCNIWYYPADSSSPNPNSSSATDTAP